MSDGARNGLLSAAAVIAISGLASRLLGLLRDRLLADRFGAGEILDAYFAAYRIPDLLYNLLVIGAFSAAFFPVVSQYLVDRSLVGRAAAFRMANALLTLAVLSLSVIALVLAAIAPSLVALLAPGFDAERSALTVLFTRIILLQPILLGASSVVSGLLLAFHRFVAYAAAPVLYNAGIIVGVLVFVPIFGVRGLAWGVVLGALLHLLVQLPAAARIGFRLRPTLLVWHQGIRQVGALFLPRLIGLLAGQFGSFVVTVLGSGLLAGSISAYVLADNMNAVPIGLVGTSLAVAAFPLLASAAARQDPLEFVGTLNRALRLILFFALPASVFVLLLRAQLVRVILGTGAFDWQDTQATLDVLGILALSVVAQSVIPLLARAFFSLHDTRTPMFASVAAISVNVVTAALLVPASGIRGLAWAFTISSLFQFLVLLTVLHTRLRGLEDKILLASAARIAVASLAAALVIQGPGLLAARLGMELSHLPGFVLPVAHGMKGIVASLVDMQAFWGVATQLVVSFASGVVTFFIVGRLLRAPELELLKPLRRKPRWLFGTLSLIKLR